MGILYPVLALLGWTVAMTIYLYVERIRLMSGNPDMQKGRHASELHAALPEKHRNTTENYNHLHEQPIIFYAICFYIFLSGRVDEFSITLAWVYFLARVVHSLVQSTSNKVTIRFVFFIIGTLCSSTLIIREIIAAL